jgi:ribosomal protein S18 acetylase RimI-like enzyme
MTATTIRPAELDDVARIAPLFDAYRVFYRQPSDPEAARAWLQARLARQESVVLLALRGREAVGFVQLYPGYSSIDLRRQWTLEDLYVLPAARRQGVAESLLLAARRHGLATGAVRLTLATAHDNLPAQTLYRKLGWQPDTIYCSYTLELV